jgi:hypothetical protein
MPFSGGGRARLGRCGLRVPRHKLKMAFARPLSLNARLRKSRDRERSIITQQERRAWLNLKNHRRAVRTAKAQSLQGKISSM